MAGAGSASTRRIASLDGLRGLAALTVVLGHARLVYVQNDPDPLVYEDGVRHVSQALGILGFEAVWLFFVLSGLVLTRMMLGAREFDYGSYVLGRLARLYLPVTGAVAFAYLTVVLIPRDQAGLGQWVDAHPDSYAVSSVIYDATLVGGASGNVSPLWSLQWEVLFSLLLILYVVLAQKVPPLLGIGGAIAASMVGQHAHSPVLLYMSMFAIGSSLAVAWDGLAARRDLIELRRGGFLYGLGVFALVALAGMVMLAPMVPGVADLTSPAVQTVTTGAAMVAITVLIVLVGLTRPLRAVFESRAMHWLGVVSFSLYLVHEPILLGFVYATRADPVWILVAVVVCMPAAHVFYRLVEKPSHRIAQRVGKRTPESPRLHVVA